MSTTALETRTVRRWERYPEYRPCQTDYISEAPAHWRIKPLKHAITFQRGHDLPLEDREEGGVPVVTSAGVSGLHNRAVAKGPGIVTGRYGTIGTFHLVESDYWPLNTTLYSIDLHGNDPRFLLYMLHPLKDIFVLNSLKSAVPGVDRNDLHPAPIALPPVPEQREMVAFLDRETARIDALIGHKERLIALLEEKRQTVISHAVTRGLNPAAPLEDSGVPWLGVVPKHWTVDRLKHRMTRVEQGWSPQCENRVVEPGEWGVLKFGCMNTGVYDESERKALPADLAPLPELEIRVGDVLMSRSNTVELVGMTGIVHQTQGRILLCDKRYRLDIRRDRLDPEFAVFLLRSSCCRSQIEPAASGASPSMRNISADIVRNLVFAFPPNDEQRAIAAHVKAVWGRIDRSQGRIRDGIARLQEYRTSLISAAVTGRIDVRGEI